MLETISNRLTRRPKRVLLVAFKQREIVDIKRQVHELDEGAFLIVCDQL